MNLQTGFLYWPTTFQDAPTYPSLQEDIKCDVLIVGGGSSGAQCAYYLANSGLDVVVVEKGRIGSGSTSSNTAIIQYSGEKLFTDLTNSFGEEVIGRHVQLCREAINEIENAQNLVDIEYEFKRRDTLYYASYEEDVERLQKEYTFLKKHQCELDFLSEEDIGKRYPFEKRAAIFSYNDAELNPFKFTHSLFDYANKNGVRIFENTEVNGKVLEKSHATIKTTTDHSIQAKQVIFAAGYECMDFKKEKKASFVSTYTVVTNPVKDLSNWYERTLIWETARPYIFMRTTADNRIIIGGLDENTFYPEDRDSKLLHKKDKLIEEFNELFPDINVHPEYYLAAFYGGTIDGLPMIGHYEEYPNCHFLLGYGDNGTVYSMMLSKIIADKIVKGNSPDLNIYLQDRPILKKS